MSSLTPRNQSAHWMGAPSGKTRRALILGFTTPLQPSTISAEAECTICLEALSSPQTRESSSISVVKPYICTHAVHKSCLEAWIEKNSTCPYCRQQIFAAPKKGGRMRSVRRFGVPFEHSGTEFVVSEEVYAQWENSVGSDEEFGMVMGFREVWDEEAVGEYVRG